ncbi:uncharacterized protein STEHIDRAFT_151205 [Stereum hirsutum FP-91666 SS1]|uniref:uncharacterized protein n=1 Tax=Stereum hirsutum (strain FP-91666) TaxID=721885 RepID=UPI000440E0B0|nr:uncharacterized protein STEHIDRAFT_151205 [Stereum hirsutum FP-91666 SS1]EIM91848.1 hypothetical protein STEHIDRAFT_151205 [Stereum hirsutum FP-91666 SS1]
MDDALSAAAPPYSSVQVVYYSPHAPISRLATELLLQIFLLLRPAHTSITDTMRDWTWLSIIHVCNRWRAVALSSAQMWTEIISSRHTSLTEFMLEHSREMALQVQHIHSTELSSSFSSILAHVHRIRNLVVRTDDDQLLGLLLKSFSESQNPNNILSILDYDILPIFRTSQDTDIAIDDQFLSSLPKKLVWLRLPRIRIKLPCLHTQTFDNLTEFHVPVLPPTSLIDIRALLGHFPNLEVLTLQSFMFNADTATPPAQPVSLPHLKILSFTQHIPSTAIAHLDSVIQFNANLCVNLIFSLVVRDIMAVSTYLDNRQRQGIASFRRVTFQLDDMGPKGSLNYNGQIAVSCNSSVESSSPHNTCLFPEAQGPHLEPGALIMSGRYMSRSESDPLITQCSVGLLLIVGCRRIESFVLNLRVHNLPYQSSTLFPAFDQFTQLTRLRLIGLVAIETVTEFVMQRVPHQSGQIPLPLLQMLVLHVNKNHCSAFVTATLDNILGAFKARQENGGKRLRELVICLGKDVRREVRRKVVDSGIAEKHGVLRWTMGETIVQG